MERNNERALNELERHSAQREALEERFGEAKQAVKAARAQLASAEKELKQANRRASEAEREAEREKRLRTTIEERLSALAQGVRQSSDAD